MNKFEKMVEALNLYEKESKKLAELKKENNFKTQQLKEQFETWKNEYEQNAKKQADAALIEQSKLKNKKQSLNKELKALKAEDVSQEFLNYINNSEKTIEKQMQKNNEAALEQKNNLNIVIKQHQKELSETINELNEELKQQKKRVKDAENSLKESGLEITINELETFLVDYLKQTTGKKFINMDDKTHHEYTEYSYSDREEWQVNYQFRGLKCVSKDITNFKELLIGIKNKEVILFDVKGRYSISLEANKLYDLEDYNSELLKEHEIEPSVYFTFLQNKNLEYSYFKIYPDLKEKLLSFIENKFIKEEIQKLENTKKYINTLKVNIDTNDEQMNKEIENTIKKIKEKYVKKLKANKISYYQKTKEYNEKKEELNAYLTNGNEIKTVQTPIEESLEK